MSDDPRTPTTPHLTERERIVLAYLSPMMEANAHMIGRHVYDNISSRHRGGSNLPAIGAAVCGRLRKKGFVFFLPDLSAWRISAAGRSALA